MMVKQLSDNNSPARLVTTREAARYLYGNDSRTTLHRLYRGIKEGDLEAKKISGTYWFTRSYLEQLTEWG